MGSKRIKMKLSIARYLGNLLKAIISIWTDRQKIGKRKSKELIHRKSYLLIAFSRSDQVKFQT